MTTEEHSEEEKRMWLRGYMTALDRIDRLVDDSTHTGLAHTLMKQVVGSLRQQYEDVVEAAEEKEEEVKDAPADED